MDALEVFCLMAQLGSTYLAEDDGELSSLRSCARPGRRTATCPMAVSGSLEDRYLSGECDAVDHARHPLSQVCHYSAAAVGHRGTDSKVVPRSLLPRPQEIRREKALDAGQADRQMLLLWCASSA